MRLSGLKLPQAQNPKERACLTLGAFKGFSKSQASHRKLTKVIMLVVPSLKGKKYRDVHREQPPPKAPPQAPSPWQPWPLIPDVETVTRQALDLGELLGAVLHLQADAVLGLQHLHVDLLHRLAACIQTAVLPRDGRQRSEGRSREAWAPMRGQ